MIATSSSDAKLEKLRELGADKVISYNSIPECGLRTREHGGGNGADHVVEFGGTGALPESLKTARNGGHVSMIGVLTGSVGGIRVTDLMMCQIGLIGITVVGALGGFREGARDERCPTDPGRKLSLERLGDAFGRQESGKHFGKIVAG